MGNAPIEKEYIYSYEEIGHSKKIPNLSSERNPFLDFRKRGAHDGLANKKKIKRAHKPSFFYPRSVLALVTRQPPFPLPPLFLVGAIREYMGNMGNEENVDICSDWRQQPGRRLFGGGQFSALYKSGCMIGRFPLLCETNSRFIIALFRLPCCI